MSKCVLIDQKYTSECSSKFDFESDEEIDVIRDDAIVDDDSLFMSLGSRSVLNIRNVSTNQNDIPKNKTSGKGRQNTSAGRPSFSRTDNHLLNNSSNGEKNTDLGEKCSIQECGVKLVNPDNMKLHRDSHQNNQGFICPLSCSRMWLGMRKYQQGGRRRRP